MDKEDRLFDERFREILGNGKEEVPAGLWDGIASGLDRIERRKKRAALFWKVACPVAAAAAVTLFVVLKPTGNETNQGIQDTRLAETTVIEKDERGDNLLCAEAATYKDSCDATDTEGICDCQSSFGVCPAGQPYPASRVEDKAKVEKNATADENSSTGLETDEPTFVDSVNDENTSKNSDKNDEINVSGEEFSRISERDFIDDATSTSKKVRVAVAMAGNTSVNVDRKVESTRRFAPAIGITPSETTLSEKKDYVNYSLPVTVGLGMKVFFAKRWAIGTGVNYTLLSKKVSVDYKEVNEESGEVVKEISTNMRNDQHYIGIPVNIYFSIIRNRHWDFYTYAGGAVDKCVANKYRNLNGSEPFSYNRKTKGVQPSVNIGLGVEFCPTEHIGIFIDPNLSYYFDCNQPRSIRTVQPLTFSASAGLRFRL